MEVVAASVATDEGLEVALSVAQAPASRRKYEQRSWPHAANARAGKAVKRAKTESQAAVARADAAEQNLSTAAVLGGLSIVRATSTTAEAQAEVTAIAQCSLGCRRAARGSGRQVAKLARAAAMMATALAAIQLDCMRALFLGRSSRDGADDEADSANFASASASSGPASKVPYCVHAFALQWDETSQRMRNIATDIRGSRTSAAQVAVQVMVRHAHLHRFCMCGSRSWSANYPFFLRPIALVNMDANHLLEALLRRLPLPLADLPAMQDATGNCDAFVLSLACDRAASNWPVAAWVFAQAQKLPPHVLPHLEPCGAHGVSLAKDRGELGKQFATALNSLSRQMRFATFQDALRQIIVQIVEATLVVRHAPRPQMYTDRAASLFDALFGGADSAFLYRVDSAGRRHEKRFLLDVRALLAIIDVDPDSSNLVHWCSVTEGSSENTVLRLSVGQPCCETRADSVDKVCVCLLNYFFGQIWEVAAVSRWVHVSKLMKKYFLGCVLRRVFPRALSDLKVFWGINAASLEGALARLMDADANEYSAKSKIRLFKICRVLCREDITTAMALTLATMMVADSVLYAFLGHDRQRATILDMCDPSASELLRALRRLRTMLTEFRPDADAWFLLRIVNADFTDRNLMVKVRAQILLLHCVFLTTSSCVCRVRHILWQRWPRTPRPWRTRFRWQPPSLRHGWSVCR